MAGSATPKTVQIYTDEAGHQPFTNWLYGLKDAGNRQRILLRLRRIESGNLGDCKHLSDGVYELRLFFGAGYRIYFGNDGDKIVIILCAGDKSTQRKDISKAINYWEKYNEKTRKS